MNKDELLASLDEKYCLNFLARMVQHKSYSETPEERRLAEFMDDQMRAIGLESRLLPVPGGRFDAVGTLRGEGRSEEHTSELQSLMRTSYAVFCLNKKIQLNKIPKHK